jgi:Bacterial regulatory proteins, luxR family
MNLELRDARVSDLGRLVQLVSPSLCDPSEREALRSMWSEIIQSRHGISCVAANVDQSFAIVHFSLCLFVSDERADEYHRCGRPLIARHLLAEWNAGGRPFLHVDEIARANAGSGLNLVVTHYGGKRGDALAAIANYEGARRALRGWNLRSYTTEIFTDLQHDDREWGRSLGYRVLEYSPDALRAAGIPQDRAPFLWVATRSDAEFSPGYGTALLFTTYAPPRFAFTPREQRVLTLALDGATDSSIASAIGISESAVKKHFRRVYEKAHACCVFGPVVVGEDPGHPTRGVEQRRRLLNFLREHPEELRPYRSAVRERAWSLASPLRVRRQMRQSS